MMDVDLDKMEEMEEMEVHTKTRASKQGQETPKGTGQAKTMNSQNSDM